MKTMLKEAGILFLITLLSGVLLGAVYEVTKDPIARGQQEAIKKACMAVFAPTDTEAGADSFREIDPDETGAALAQEGLPGVEIGTVFEALAADGSRLGYVIETTSSEGYGGNIVLYVGVSNSMTLRDVSILQISETAGLGMQAEDVLVPQLHNLHAEEITYTKTGKTAENEIDAISGATVTTKAVTNAVNGALRYASYLIAQEGGAM